MAQLNFNATLVQPNSGQPDPIPAGWYNVVMDQSEIKPTKDGTGAYLECRFNIVDGAFTGHKVYSRLNIHNSNQKAVDIAMGQLSAIAHAVNVLHVQDSSQLHNIPLKIKVKLRAATADYEASNEVSSYKNINEVVPSETAAAHQYSVNTVPVGVPPQMPPQTAPQMPPQMPQQPWQQAPAQQAPAYQPPAGQAMPPAMPAFSAAPPPGVTFPGGTPAAQAPQQQVPQQTAPAPGQGAVPPWLSNQQG